MTERRHNLRPLHLLTVVLIISVSVLGVQACGGEQLVDAATVAAMGAGEFQKLVSDATDDLVAHLGDDEAGFYAAILALDQGYDVYQLLTGALNDRVQPDGHIKTAEGSDLAPARDPENAIEVPPDNGAGTGLLAYNGPVLVASVSNHLLAADTPYQAARKRRMLFWGGAVLMGEYFGEVKDRYEELKEQEELYGEFYDKIAFLTTALAARGYGVQQIFEGILLDQVRVFLDPEGDGTFCFYIEHDSGVVLRPLHAPADPLAELTCPSADKDAPAGFDPALIQATLTERGLGEYASGETTAPGDENTPTAPGDSGGASGIQEGSGNGEGSEPSSPAGAGKAWVFEGTGLFVNRVDTEGSETCKDSACPFVLTLFPDGRAEFLVTRGFGWADGKCVERAGNLYVGSWEGDSFAILGQFSADGPVVDPSMLIEGIFTAEIATGGGSYDNEAGFSGEYDFEDPGLTRKAN